MTLYQITIIVCNMLPEAKGDGLTQVKLLSDPQKKRVSSQSLLGGQGELLIVHNGREYRLRLTQHGKLILTA